MNQDLRKLYRQNSEEILRDYFTFLSFQSISSDPKYNGEMIRCVEWLKEYIQKIGFRFKCELWPTSGHPVLFASWMDAGPDKPTLLIYNHYDVQPVDPLNEWETPPFEPTIRNGEVYARGAQDNKGQCFYVLQALKLLFEKDRRLPINIKLCIEGEEECGSHGLSGILDKRKEQLKADYLAIVDLGMKSSTQPALTLGLRGITTMDVEFIGANCDMHSGEHGGIAYNPIHALIETLSKLRDSSGKVMVPGFYDEVLPLEPSELQQLAVDFNRTEYENLFDAKPLGGEKGYSPLERGWTRPTLEINGITGGYSGQGFKTVIPAKASAKISCRLVPNQVPEVIARRVADYIKKMAPEEVKVVVTLHPGGGSPLRSSLSSKVVKAFSKAFEEVYGVPCKFILAGGSIPITVELALASKSDVVLLGLGLADDRIHAPNEHFGIDRLEKGALAVARALELL